MLKILTISINSLSNGGVCHSLGPSVILAVAMFALGIILHRSKFFQLFLPFIDDFIIL